MVNPTVLFTLEIPQESTCYLQVQLTIKLDLKSMSQDIIPASLFIEDKLDFDRVLT